MMMGVSMMRAADLGKPVTWDAKSLIIDGHRVCPVMGEIHYSRVPQDEWQREVRKMREGGVTIIATYIFWNHIEEQEGGRTAQPAPFPRDLPTRADARRVASGAVLSW